MKIHHHAAFSVIISGILYMIFKSWSLSTACLITGIFIDLDHLFDYVREHGWLLNIRHFFRIHNKCQYRRIVLFCHGWEWLVLFTVAAWIIDWNPWMTGVLIGLSQHMVLDALYNSHTLLSYSLIWRWKNGFDYDIAFGKRRPRIG